MFQNDNKTKLQHYFSTANEKNCIKTFTTPQLTITVLRIKINKYKYACKMYQVISLKKENEKIETQSCDKCSVVTKWLMSFSVCVLVNWNPRSFFRTISSSVHIEETKQWKTKAMHTLSKFIETRRPFRKTIERKGNEK